MAQKSQEQCLLVTRKTGLSDEVVPVADAGSFKDPAGRVYRIGGTAGGRRILRGLNQTAATVMAELLATPFFSELRVGGHVVNTALLAPTDPDARRVMAEGWSVVATAFVGGERATWLDYEGRDAV